MEIQRAPLIQEQSPSGRKKMYISDFQMMFTALDDKHGLQLHFSGR